MKYEFTPPPVRLTTNWNPFARMEIALNSAESHFVTRTGGQFSIQMNKNVNPIPNSPLLKRYFIGEGQHGSREPHGPFVVCAWL
jgi:hypothetical protein